MRPELATPPRRTIAPVFWLLFGAGGMLAAVFGPALIVITGFMIPHGWGIPVRVGSYENVLAMLRNPVGELAALVIIALFFWHAAERLFLTLKDMRAGTPRVLRWCTYGAAALLSLLTAVLLLAIGF